MRKLSVCVVALVLFLCGCNGKKEITPTVSGIKFVAKITYYNEQYECDAVISDGKNMSLTVNSPDNIKGLKVDFADNRITAEFMGITYEPKLDSMPFASISKTVYTILSQIKEENLKAVYEKSNCVICGKCGERNYEFTFSPSGLPIMLEIVNESYKIEFCNVSVM